jgi:hypothetical protein
MYNTGKQYPENRQKVHEHAPRLSALGREVVSLRDAEVARAAHGVDSVMRQIMPELSSPSVQDMPPAAIVSEAPSVNAYVQPTIHAVSTEATSTQPTQAEEAARQKVMLAHATPFPEQRDV